MCTFTSNSTSLLDVNPLVSKSTELFNQPSGLAEAVTDFSFSTATISAPSISIIRIVKTFRISGGAWVFVS